MNRLLNIISLCLLSMLSNKGYTQCNPSLWSHVYNSYRLQVNNSCMTVSGTAYSLIYEADGDIHIRLTVDSPYTYMLNSVNYSGQYGKLVCEPVCATTVTQADAISSCTGFTNTVFIPAVGEHVLVTGSYVTDNDHGWNEIHPITSIVIGSGTSVSNINTTKSPEVILFPNPATSHVNFKLSAKPSGPVYIIIADELGLFAGQYQMFDMLNLEINTQYLHSGKYFYRIRQDDKLIKSGDFIIVK